MNRGQPDLERKHRRYQSFLRPPGLFITFKSGQDGNRLTPSIWDLTPNIHPGREFLSLPALTLSLSSIIISILYGCTHLAAKDRVGSLVPERVTALSEGKLRPASDFSDHE